MRWIRRLYGMPAVRAASANSSKFAISGFGFASRKKSSPSSRSRQSIRA
jgi:hypothetical protein